QSRRQGKAATRGVHQTIQRKFHLISHRTHEERLQSAQVGNFATGTGGKRQQDGRSGVGEEANRAISHREVGTTGVSTPEVIVRTGIVSAARAEERGGGRTSRFTCLHRRGGRAFVALEDGRGIGDARVRFMGGGSSNLPTDATIIGRRGSNGC